MNRNQGFTVTNFVENIGRTFSGLNDKLEKSVRDHLVNVYATVAMGVGVAAGGASVHLFTDILRANLLLSLVSIGLMFALISTPHSKENQNKRLGFFFAFCGLSGLGMGPLLERVILIDPSVVLTAFLSTTIVFGCFSLSALHAPSTKYLHLGGALASATLCLIFATFFLSKAVIILIGLALSCGFVLYDTQLIAEKSRRGDDDYIWHSVDLFIDFVQIFRFHTIHIAISHENHTIQLTVDGQIPIALRDKSFHGMQLSSLLFGASPPSNGAHELGITACLKNIYVDHYDIIGMMFEGDKRVKSSKPLRSCSDSQNIVLTASSKRLFDSDPVSIQDINREESRNHLEEAILGHTVEGVGSQEDTDPSAIVEFGISEGHVSVLLENGVYSSKEKVDSAAVYQSPPKKTGSQTLICDKSQDYVCRNGASCEKRATGIKCLCRNGFGGKYCQFVLLPRTCAEALLFFLLPDGPTKLDIDGSRSLSPSIALCQKGHFDRKLTWFHVASNNRTVSQIGKVPHSCVCLDKGCINHGFIQGKCNCDSQAITQDAGYLFGKDAGITRMVAIREDGDVSGKITIGQLCCEGFGGSEAIRFTARRSLPVRDWNGEPFSFQFRTADSSCLLLRHSIRVLLSKSNITVESQAKLNDTKWHLIVLEFMENEIRIGVDKFNAFGSLDGNPLPKGKLIINDDIK
uniref:EGF-like domain-containing protein n=1 Tax=Heterorhabditis bacteriophora TaxID=37862 RepID=A0A1I7XR93_HETBA